MKARDRFFLFIACLGAGIGACSWQMFSEALPFLHRIPCLLPFLIFPFLFALPQISWGYRLPFFLLRPFAIVGGLTFILLFYSMFLLVPYGLLALAMHFAPMNFLYASQYFSYFSLAILVILLPIGVWQALFPRVVHISLNTQKLLREDVHLAFLSDIHLGQVLGTWFSRHLVRKVNNLGADIILIGGDIIDGNLNYVLADGSLTPFQDLKAKYGTLAAFGNHDGYSFQLKRERQTLETLGIKVLEGETYKLGTNVEILGMRDFMFFPQDKLPPASKEAFAIVIDHEPRRMQEAAQKNYDLYLAGHTHGGQFFPFNYATRRLFPLSYGVARFDKLLAYVTAGFGAWGAPFRLGQRAEIVLIHVHSEGEGNWAVPRCY